MDDSYSFLNVIERPAPKKPINADLKTTNTPYYISIVLKSGKSYFNLLDADHTDPSCYPSKFCMHGFSRFIGHNSQIIFIRNDDISAYSVQDKTIPTGTF